jgi:urease accessory protein
VHFTSQASTIIHTMYGQNAEQIMTITAKSRSYVEYLPDPQILFPNSKFNSKIKIKIDEGATVLISDSFLTHDPSFQNKVPDLYQSEIIIDDGQGKTLAIDRLNIENWAFQTCTPGILGDYKAHGTFILASQDPLAPLIHTMSHAIGDGLPKIAMGVSLLPNSTGVIFRILAADGIQLRKALHACWSLIRKYYKGSEPIIRKK